MRRRYIQDPDTLKLIPVEEYESPPQAGFFVSGDIGPYRSMVTGEWVEGRRDHREHLKRHNVVEVGNDFDNAKPKTVGPPPGLKQRLIEVFNSKL